MAHDPSASPPVPWTWRDVLLAIIAAAVLYFLEVWLVNGPLYAPLRGLEHALARGGLSTHVFGLILGSLVAYVAAAVAIALFIVRSRGASWRTLGFRALAPSRLGVAILAFPATVITANSVMVLYTQIVLHNSHFVNPQQQEIAGNATRTVPNVVGLVLIVVVLAPLVEETVFRGVLYQWLRKHLPVWAAAGISAAIFAAAHNIPEIFPWLFITGVALALVFEYCQSIAGSALLHALVNSVGVIALLTTLPKH